ncbi:MAG: hypothetical protein KatS3mg111_2261 [Pirellulaceae bacterium]|nr:MAG: hypothetical protein KatS3mg111_2261 [Pirellulaceae bacterium]
MHQQVPRVRKGSLRGWPGCPARPSQTLLQSNVATVGGLVGMTPQPRIDAHAKLTPDADLLAFSRPVRCYNRLIFTYRASLPWSILS